MKRLLSLILSLAFSLTLSLAQYALPLDSLYGMSLRMEHSEFLAEALRHESQLKATPSSEWMRLLGVKDADPLALRCMPTLYDIVASEQVHYSYHSDREALAHDLVHFHARDTNLLARAYAYSHYPTSQHLQYYDSLPDCWERGLLLRNNPGSRYDSAALPLLETYLAHYPASPFAETLRHRREQILQLSIHTHRLNIIPTSDSIRVDFSLTNAHEVAFYLCRASRRRQVIDSCRVHIDTPERLFTRNNLHIAFPPQRPGQYRIEVRLPEDTVHYAGKPYPFLLTMDVLVSDLCSFTFYESRPDHRRDRLHVIATDALSGEAVACAQVQGTTVNKKRLFRLTNRQGEASIALRHTDYTATTRVRKQHNRSLETYNYFYQPKLSTDLRIYPNTTILRPGDTLRAAIIATRLTIDSLRTISGDYLHLSIINPRNRAQFDTLITTDAYGEVSLQWAVPKDAMLGRYSLRITDEMQAPLYGRSAQQNLYFEVADYRLPTFALTLDARNHHLRVGDTIGIFRGSARLFSGLPMRDLTIQGTCTHDLQTLPFTVQTDFDGSFSFALPDSLLRQLRPYETLLLRVEATTPDGESHSATQYIFLRDTATNPYHPEPAASLNPWPQEQPLWVPQDSLRYSANGQTVSVLIGTRSTSPLYIITSSRKQLLSHEWHTLPTGLNRLSFTLPTDTNDYLDIQVITTIHGHVSMESVRAEAPLRTEVHLIPISFRNYLQPGAPETWLWQLRDQQHQPIEGRLLATLIDEAVYSLAPRAYPALPDYWQRACILPRVTNPSLNYGSLQSLLPQRTLLHLSSLPLYEPYQAPEEVIVTGMSASSKTVKIRGAASLSTNEVVLDEAPMFKASFAGSQAMETSQVAANEEVLSEVVVVSDTLQQIPLREGDTRLAFFLPALTSDSAGYIRHSFRAPLDNTRWRLQGLAWSRQGACTRLDTIITARRNLTAHVTVPRFLRQSDQVALPCLVRNEADSAQIVHIVAEISLPSADSVLLRQQWDTVVNASHELLLPLSCSAATTADSLLVRLYVRGRDGASDGEQRILPVLSVIEPVQEGTPFYLHPGDSAVALRLPALPDGATDASLILSYCSNPLAYLFGGLPTAVDTGYVTPLPLAHHLFTLAVGNRLAATYPGYRDSVDIASLTRALRRFQRTNGGFSWLQDNRSAASAYITLQLVYLLGELQAVNALPADLRRVTERAIQYLDRTYASRIEEDEKLAQKNKQKIDYALYSEYAFARSFFPSVAFAADAERPYQRILDAMPKQSNLLSAPYQALCLERAGHHQEALHLIHYLRKRATSSADLGLYFNNLPKYHLWFSVCEQQAAYLRAFAAIDPRPEEIEGLRQWLLLSRQTTRWGESSLSAYAASALLLSGEEWLQPTAATANPQGLTIDTLPYTADYSSPLFTLRDGRLSLHTAGSNSPAWGSVTLCYRAPLSAIRPYQQKAMAVERRYSLLRGEEEQPISYTTILRPGDRVRVAFSLTIDREMDGLILRDHKPAALEPMDAHNGYEWQPAPTPAPQLRTIPAPWWSGTLLYRQFRNEEVCLYIEHLPRGTFCYHYDCYVTTSGLTLSGLLTAGCELAPEFDAHTDVHLFHVR